MTKYVVCALRISSLQYKVEVNVQSDKYMIKLHLGSVVGKLIMKSYALSCNATNGTGNSIALQLDDNEKISSILEMKI